MDNHFSVYDPVTALAAVDEHKAIVFVCLGIDAILSFLYFIITLRMTNEAFEIGQIDVTGSGTATPPKLQISYVRPFKFGVP